MTQHPQIATMHLIIVRHGKNVHTLQNYHTQAWLWGLRDLYFIASIATRKQTVPSNENESEKENTEHETYFTRTQCNLSNDIPRYIIASLLV